MTIPPSVNENPEALKVYEEATAYSRQAFDRLMGFGVPKEDARFVMLAGTSTKLVMTLNARALMHMIWQRSTQSAQWEFKELVKQLHEEARKVAPVLFEKIVEC